MKIYMNIPSAAELASQLGIDENGPVQMQHTQNILRRMLKYMPMQTGMFSTKQTRITNPHTIETAAPQAYYLYYGKRMVNSKTGKGPRFIPGVGYRWPRGATLTPTGKPLKFTTTFHPLAGPYWDKRLMSNEGEVIARELSAMIKNSR